MMQKEQLTCASANRVDMVDFLYSIGYSPQKIRDNSYWYLSPLREEKTPSFKIARRLNVWYDHGIGKGGNLVDFGVLFYGCSVKEFLQLLEGTSTLNFSFHQPISAGIKTLEEEEKTLIVTETKPITSPHLISYLGKRNIELELASQYLKEVLFSLFDKQYTALGFQNRSGGFELRNEHFKGSSSPKDVTLIDNKSESIAVFEGCFSFLSYLSLAEKTKLDNGSNLSEGQSSFLVLNSLSFLERSRGLMEQHSHIRLYLDRDMAGLKATEKVLTWSSKYKDESMRYHGHKDLNDYLRNGQKERHTPQLTKKQGRGIHF